MPIINQVVKGGGGSAPAHYVEKTVDANGKLKNSSSFIDLTGVTDLGESVLQNAYAYVAFPANTTITIPCTNISGSSALSSCFINSNTYNYQNNITTFSCPNLKIISGGTACESTFYDGGRYLTNVNFDNLEEISGYGSCRSMFGCGNQYGSHTLATVSLPKLKKITGTQGCYHMFWYQTNITTFEMPELEQVTALNGCEGMLNATAITSFKFQSLNTLTGTSALKQMFGYCSSLQSLWFYALNTNSFGAYTNQFNQMLQGVTGCTVHFPIRIQSTIGSWATVTAGFSGTNTTVLFDIVTTLTGADGNTYTRQEKDSTTTATAWVYNDTLYYTSGVSDNANGVNEPAVSDAIYSDAECTQSVTTITAIA